MIQKMVQMIQLLSLVIALMNGIDFVVSRVKGGRKAAEKLRHGQIVVSAQNIAAPQISVVQGRKIRFS